MKREIKFRGKRVGSDDWIYGFYHYSELYGCQFIKESEKREDGIVEHSTEVQPDTVGQYTGLKDKEGKEIYEGDVLKVNKAHDYYINRNYIVFYDDAAFQIETKDIVGRCAIVKFIYDAFHKDEIEEFSDYTILFTVLGNIHDNPELIQTPQ